jgi:hypothetical protein
MCLFVHARLVVDPLAWRCCGLRATQCALAVTLHSHRATMPQSDTTLMNPSLVRASRHVHLEARLMHIFILSYGWTSKSQRP